MVGGWELQQREKQIKRIGEALTRRTGRGREDTCSRVLSVLLAKGNTEFPATLAQTLLESSKQQCAEGLNVAPDSDSRVWHDCI
jgi:hypothetical protein